MDEIKSLIESKLKKLLQEVNEDEGMSFRDEYEYYDLIVKYIDLMERFGEQNDQS